MEPERSNESARAAVFAVQHVPDVVQRLSEDGFDSPAIGVLMSDRTAERHFSLGQSGVRDDSGSLARTSTAVAGVAAALRPMTALGVPGTGLVAAGWFPAALTSAGIGSRSLDAALQQLGVRADDARHVEQQLRNGAVLIGVLGDPARLREAEAGALSAGEKLLPLAAPHTRGPERAFVPPQAPAGDQRARYQPPLDFGQDASGQRTASSKFKS